MAIRLKSKDWIEIRTKYELGNSIRSIAREHDITDGAIRSRIKLEGWTQELREQVSEVKQNIDKITQSITHEQLPLVHEQLQKQLDDTFEIMRAVTNIHKGAMNLHQRILQKAMHDLATGSTTPMEASRILANQGVSVDKIHTTYTPKANTNIQINNSGETTSVNWIDADDTN